MIRREEMIGGPLDGARIEVDSAAQTWTAGVKEIREYDLLRATVYRRQLDGRMHFVPQPPPLPKRKA